MTPSLPETFIAEVSHGLLLTLLNDGDSAAIAVPRTLTAARLQSLLQALRLLEP
jgi:hypothetical protein